MTMREQHKNYLAKMGIQTWSSRAPASIAIAETPTSLGISANISHWDDLKQQVSSCQLCPLAQTRIQAVFGVGNERAKLMIIGEAPGFYEDQQGEPFVGRAGQLLNQMLRAIGLNREEVFIANVLKCRPPENRDPLPQEIRTCTQYLTQQIQYIKPTLIVAVGRIAGQYLLGTSLSMRELRKQPHDYQGIPLMITYHPAYLLRSPKDKMAAYQDLLKVKAHLQVRWV